MKMTLRWYGPGFDSVTLEQIRQIPGVTGVITTLYDIPAGEEWPRERIHELKRIVEEAGLKIEGIESVNIHDAIKIGTPDRDRYIRNYINTLEHLGQEGIDLVCYNFMPVFDWTRTDLAKMRPDGSTVLAYDQKVVDSIDPQTFFNQTNDNSNGFVMPGWEPERLSHVAELFEAYKDVDSDKLFNNLVYFLEAIGPVCEKYGIKMAIHPDDPAWPVFGLPRIITGKDAILRLFKAVDKDYNGLTFCTGSLGAGRDNHLLRMAEKYARAGRIPFAHIRQIRYRGERDFAECGHLTAAGSLDIFGIVRALVRGGFDGYVRPDHGRNIWGEDGKPGYGLYDRALGATYLNGLFEAVQYYEREN